MRRLVLTATILCSCSLTDPAGIGADFGPRPDAPPEGVAADSLDEDAERDGALVGPGPLTFVASHAAPITERLCDLDGDGTLDNSIADLGSPGDALFASALEQAVSGFIEERGIRIVLGFSHVEDRAGPTASQTLLFTAVARERDTPTDPSDDLSGHGAFLAWPSSLDQCGEPAFLFATAQLDEGRLVAEDGVVPVPSIALTRGASMVGTLDRGGAGGEAELCAYALIRELGQQEIPPRLARLNALELFLAGGAVVGVPSVRGLSPDLDLDGDGLERVMLDESFRITSCIDGDNQEIAGRDCWLDPRMADAFSINLALSFVPAQLPGPWPAAGYPAEEVCASPFGGESLWRPCDFDGAGCHERGATEPCAPPCGTEGSRRCSPDCAGWSSCMPRDRLRLAFESCEGLVPEGAASCEAAMDRVRLVTSGTGLVGAASPPGHLAAGYGPITIEARVSAQAEGTGLPADGWSIAVYTDDGAPMVGSADGDAGLHLRRHGFGLRWRWNATVIPPAEEWDKVDLLALDGSGDRVFLQPVPTSRQAWPRLDSGGSDGVVQAMRLVIQPDDPTTADDELSAMGYAFTEEGSQWTGATCLAAECLERIEVGDPLHIGVAAASGEGGASATLLELTITTEGVCPDP